MASALPTTKRRARLRVIDGRVIRSLYRTEFESVLAVAQITPDLLSPMLAMMERGDEFKYNTTARLAGLAATARGRGLLEHAIDRASARDSEYIRSLALTTPPFFSEVVLGSGFHAAVYVSTRGGGIVIDKRPRLGGTFALGSRPVFYLNSRNRAEQDLPRRPGTKGPLNSLVGCPIQPSDLGFQEYQDQTDLAFATRLNLALFARPLLGVELLEVNEKKGEGWRGRARYSLRLSGSKSPGRILTNRIIVASGLGEPDTRLMPDSDPDERVMTFERFCERVGDPSNKFPLRGFKKVAVIGAKDSGNVAVEYLLGQGPNPGMSVAGLDYVEQISWIGQPRRTKEEFEECNRSRYMGIGRALPRAHRPSYDYRVTPVDGKATSLKVIDGGVRVRVMDSGGNFGTDTFDYVILATGYVNRVDDIFSKLVPSVSPLTREVIIDDIVVATRYTGHEIYKVGPAAQLRVTESEREETPALQDVPDNSEALFRYAERTAALARSLDGEVPNIAPLTTPITAERRQFTQFSQIPFGKPAILPEGAASEDIVRCVTREVFQAQRRQDRPYSIVVTRSKRVYEIVVSPLEAGWLWASAAQLVADPSVQAILAHYTQESVNPRGSVEIHVPFRDNKLNVEGVRIVRAQEEK